MCRGTRKDTKTYLQGRWSIRRCKRTVSATSQQTGPEDSGRPAQRHRKPWPRKITSRPRRIWCTNKEDWAREQDSVVPAVERKMKYIVSQEKQEKHWTNKYTKKNVVSSLGSLHSSPRLFNSFDHTGLMSQVGLVRVRKTWERSWEDLPLNQRLPPLSLPLAGENCDKDVMYVCVCGNEQKRKVI